MQKRALALEDLRHERAQGLGDRQNQQKKYRDLKNTVRGHVQNFSGFNSA